MEGLSASVIAEKLGGTTRNAVIGKVHRIGLAGRATTSRKPARLLSPFAGAREIQRPQQRKFMSRAPVNFPKPATAKSFTLPDLGPAPANTVNVASLTDFTCRYPIGDPKLPGFHFCGRGTSEHGPYCAHHAAIAFQPLRRAAA